jgi:DNA-binding transcriptional LysR family regulator
MDLHQLTYLIAVADEGGFRAAARRTRVAQPQLSLAVRRLEREFGVELLRRTSRGVQLTTAGEELVARARDLLDQVADARTAIRRIAEHQATTLRVGLCPGSISGAELLRPILLGYMRSRPAVRLELEDLGYQGQLKRVLDGSVDVAIVRAPIVHPELVVVPVASEPRVLMVGATHELAQEQSVDVGELLGRATLPIDASAEYSSFWQLDDLRGAPKSDPEIRPVTALPEAQLRLATRDVIITSPASVARLAPSPLTVTIPLEGASPAVIAIAFKRGPSLAIRDFVDCAQEAAERNIDALPGGALAGGSARIGPR